MAVSNEDIDFDLHDNRAFVADDESKDDDANQRAGSDATAESSFQPNDERKKTSTISRTQDELRTIVTACIFFGVSVAVALILTIYLGPPQVAPHGAVSGKRTSCSDVGGRVLKSGGSAVDCSIATILCESLYDERLLYGCGVFVFHDQPKNSSRSLDFGCSGGRAADGDRSVEGAALLKGLARIHEELGVLKWRDVLQPVLNLFQSDSYLPDDSKHTFTSETKTLFEGIAVKGVDYFYSNFLLTKNRTGMNAAQLDNFKSYVPTIKDPSKLIFKGYFLEAVPGCSSVSLFMLMEVLENLTTSGRVKWNATDFYHYFVEAVKVIEMHLDNITKLEPGRKLWSDLAEYLASLINDRSAVKVPHSNERETNRDVIFVNAIDPYDNLISLAVWFNGSEGSRNSAGRDDACSGGYSEDVVSTIAHNAVKPCALRFAMTGSSYLDVAQVLINHFGQSMNISEAILAPRIRVEGDAILYQDDLSQEVLAMLKSKNHSDLRRIPSDNSTSESYNFVSTVFKDKEKVDSCADEGRATSSIF